MALQHAVKDEVSVFSVVPATGRSSYAVTCVAWTPYAAVLPARNPTYRLAIDSAAAATNGLVVELVGWVPCLGLGPARSKRHRDSHRVLRAAAPG